MAPAKRPLEDERDADMDPVDDDEKEVGGPDLLRALAAMSLAEDEDWWKHGRKGKDKHEWEPDPDATAFARELLACQPEGLGAGVQLFRVGVDWLNDEQYHPWTFTRECTRQLARIARTSDGMRKILLTGNPGVGKSRFLWELLRDVMRYGRLVVLELRKKGAVFVFVPPRPGEDGGEYRAFWVAYSRWKPASCAALYDKQTYWLIDPAEAADAGNPDGHPKDLSARTVLAASPNKAHYKGWHKHELVQTRYMPPWSLEELLAVVDVKREVMEAKLPAGARAAVEARDSAAGHHEPKRLRAEMSEEEKDREEWLNSARSSVRDVDALSAEAVRERFERYGGMIHIVYSSAKARVAYDGKMETALDKMPDDKMRVAFETATEVADLDKAKVGQESTERVSSKLFVYASVYPFKAHSVAPASGMVMQLVRKAYMNRVIGVRDPTVAAYRDAFEHFSGCHVAGAFEATRLDRPAVVDNLAAGVPAHLNGNAVAFPPSRFASGVAMQSKKWKEVLKRIVDDFSSAVAPAEPDEGWAQGWTRPDLVVKPNNTNQPVLDFFEVAWVRHGDDLVKVPVAYQATVSTEHRMSAAHLRDLLDGLGCTPERPLVMVFVVPEHVFVSRLVVFRRQKAVFDEFRAQTCKGEADKAKHQELLNRVVQYKCGVPFPNKK